MSLIQTCLVIGGGIAGMSCATALAAQAVKVEIVEIDADWRVCGAGISVISPTLRAFGELGLLDEISRLGFCSAGLRVFTPMGHKIFEVPRTRARPRRRPSCVRSSTPSCRRGSRRSACRCGQGSASTG